MRNGGHYNVRFLVHLPDNEDSYQEFLQRVHATLPGVDVKRVQQRSPHIMAYVGLLKTKYVVVPSGKDVLEVVNPRSGTVVGRLNRSRKIAGTWKFIKYVPKDSSLYNLKLIVRSRFGKEKARWA